ncbi:MAG: amino acid adenylation domain-containing protein [Opitutus sp.]|nr:amino acid adenylation domain-containing protein [Opitutus sp.]
MTAASAPKLSYPREASLVDLWQQQVQTHPDQIAAIEGKQRATYADLDRWSSALALRLARLGAGPDTRVAVAIDRSIELLVAWLAVLKTGAAYVPLDTDYPAARVSQMLENAAVTAVVGLPQFTEQLPALSLPIVTFDLASLAHDASTFQSPSIPAEAPAYVMFTSGSTGRPKGAVVSHRAIVQLVRGQTYVPFGPELVFLVIASPAFDAITFEVWGALLNGGRCAIYRATQVDFVELETLIRTHGVTTSFLATRLFNRIVDLRPSTLAGLRHLVIGGEALSPVHIRRALAALPGVALVNGYGPTECTTFACTYPIPGDGRWPGDSVPIGHPLAHTVARVLDDSLQPVAPGGEGELYLGGDGVADGYFQRPELTAERFVELRETDGCVRRFYRTGDICQLLPDGALVFRGRRDGQVKLRGFRIELEEIETALRQHAAVQEAAVALQPGFGGSPQLFAYLVPVHARAFSTDRALRQWISARLPAYMAPAHYRITSALPLTANGKLDRARLPQWTATELPPDAPHRDPSSATEQVLAAIWGEALGIKRLGIDRDFSKAAATRCWLCRSRRTWNAPSAANFLRAFFSMRPRWRSWPS